MKEWEDIPKVADLRSVLFYIIKKSDKGILREKASPNLYKI